MKKINILITGASSSNSITFIKGLRQQKEIGFNIFGTDIYDKELSLGFLFCNKVFQIPKAKNKQLTPTLLKICLKNEIKILVPMIDEEFMAISRARNDFAKIGTSVMLPDGQVLETCLNKIKFCEFLKESGFPVPKWYLSKPTASALPLIRKPIFGRGSQNIDIIRDKKELYDCHDGRKFFYQKYVQGLEFTIDTLSDLKGKVLCAIPRLRLEIINGKSTKAKTVRNKIIEQTAKDICTKLKLTGPACLQCILDKKGIPYYFEANPRIGSATIISVRSGINIPLLATKLLLGREINKIPPFKKNLIMLRYFEEFYNIKN